MREYEFKEIQALINKTENCFATLKNRIGDYKLDAFSSNETKHGDFREPLYRLKKKIDWNIVRARRAYNYSWRKIADEVGVSHTTLIKRARKMNIRINQEDV